MHQNDSLQKPIAVCLSVLTATVSEKRGFWPFTSYDSAAGTTVNWRSTSPDWGLKTVRCRSVHRCPRLLGSTVTGVDSRWTACLLCRSQCSGRPGVAVDSSPDVTLWLAFSRHSNHIATPFNSPRLHRQTTNDTARLTNNLSNCRGLFRRFC